MFESSSSAGHLTNWAARLFQRALDRRMRPLGISSGQVPILLSLANKERLSQKDLVDRAAVTQPAMAAILKRMHARGLIIRCTGPEDRRASLVHLTPQAEALLDPLFELLWDGNEQAFEGFNADERFQLINMLRKLIRNLDQAGLNGQDSPGSKHRGQHTDVASLPALPKLMSSHK